VIKWLRTYLNQPSDIAPLAAFRLIFGALMFLATIRFAAHGWIEEMYVEPQFFFSYFGFEWLPRPSEFWTYVLFALTAISALMVCLGFRYRLAIVVFFLSFTYVELLDKANYLNHYYFISVVAFAMIFLPAAENFSLDSRRKKVAYEKAPRWAVLMPMVLVGIVYVFAGLAKVNTDWLFEANPLAIWLPQHVDFPLIGQLLAWKPTAYIMAWGGTIYDLTIVFFLAYKPTRRGAFAAVVVFHVLTCALFPIGMFPFIMIGLTTVFFSAHLHRRWLGRVYFVARDTARLKRAEIPRVSRIAPWILVPFLILQLLLPFRSALYSSDVHWAEEGYRFSWRVMLMEKAGHAIFFVKDAEQPGELEVDLADHLTANQIKQLSTQPDMILEFAHHLEKVYQATAIPNPEVRAEVWVTLNGEGSKLLIDPHLDLTKVEDSFAQKNWVLPRSNQSWLTDAK